MKNKTRQILLNVVGSLAFLSLPILFSPDLNNPVGFFRITGFQRDFIGYLLLFLFFYFNYLYLVPALLFKKKYVLFTLCVLLCFALILILPNMFARDISSMSIEHIAGKMIPAKRFYNYNLQSRLFQFLLVFTFSLLLRTSLRLKQAEKEKSNAELSYLKSQINPHFLFNILNSIYSLAINKSDETATAVVRLSGMMRYITSESNQHQVSLEKEINYLINYIELQKLRLEDTVKIDFKLTGSTEGKQIAPLILIPFIENAFKHGVNPEENSVIEISIMINPSGIRLIVFNNKVNKVHDDGQRSGLGIKNASARLQLLYPGKHLLVIDDNTKYFSIDLIINT